MYRSIEAARDVQSPHDMLCTGQAAPVCSLNVIVVDLDGRIVEATEGSRSLLAKGNILIRSFERLATVTRGDDARLSKAMVRASATGSAAAILVGMGDVEAVEVNVAMLESCTGQMHLVLLLKVAREDRQRRLAQARASYGLTPAETRLLATLFDGCSVPQAASRLGVARTTARTHLQRIFEKTGARRQGDLLCMVASA